MLPEREMARFWERRRRRYEDWLAEEDSLLLVAFRGAGKLLLDAVAEHFAELGVETLALGVLPANQGARRFYEREGFEAVMLEMVQRPRGSRGNP